MGYGSNPLGKQPGLKGLDKMMKTLNTTKDKTTKKVAKSSIHAGLRQAVKAMRSQINATSASKRLKKASRKAVGKSLKKKGGFYVGKVGLSVGKPSKAKREAALARYYGSTPGSGVSAKNIHWYVFGTKERENKKSHAVVLPERNDFITVGKRKGTGKIKPVFKNVVPVGVRTAIPAMRREMGKKASQVLARETAKARK